MNANLVYMLISRSILMNLAFLCGWMGEFYLIILAVFVCNIMSYRSPLSKPCKVDDLFTPISFLPLGFLHLRLYCLSVNPKPELELDVAVES